MTTFNQLAATKPKPTTSGPSTWEELLKPTIGNYFLLAILADGSGNVSLRDMCLADITAIVAVRRQEASHAT